MHAQNHWAIEVFSLYIAGEKESKREGREREKRADDGIEWLARMLSRWTAHEEELKTGVELKRAESKQRTEGMKNEKRRLPVDKPCWWHFPSPFHRHYHRFYSAMLNAFWQIEWFFFSLSLPLLSWIAFCAQRHKSIDVYTGWVVIDMSLFILRRSPAQNAHVVFEVSCTWRVQD